MRVKVTIRAFAHAPGNVNIETQRDRWIELQHDSIRKY